VFQLLLQLLLLSRRLLLRFPQLLSESFNERLVFVVVDFQLIVCCK